MSRVLDDFLLFSCLAAFVTGIVLGNRSDGLNVCTPAARGWSLIRTEPLLRQFGFPARAGAR